MSGAGRNKALKNHSGWDEFDLKLIKILGDCLGIVFVVSTYLHFWAPHVLRVPPTPVPDNTFLDMLYMEILTVVMAFLCGVHCFRKFGPYATMLFFVGSFVFTGTMENIMILTGRFELIPLKSY